MLTLFSMPKGFIGHIGVIQRNAIGGWAVHKAVGLRRRFWQGADASAAKQQGET